MTAQTTTTRRVLYTCGRENEVLRAVVLSTQVERRAQGEAWVEIKVGVQVPAEPGVTQPSVTWIGEWTERHNRMTPGRPIRLTGQQDLHFPLGIGAQVVAHLTMVGLPESPDSMTLEVRTKVVGAVGTGRSRSDRPDLPGPRPVTRPAFSLGHTIWEPQTRQAVEALEDRLNSGGIVDKEVAHPLSQPISFVDRSYDTAEDAGPVNNVAGTVTVLTGLTLTPPDKRAYMAVVIGRASLSEPGGLGATGRLRIQNATDSTNFPFGEVVLLTTNKMDVTVLALEVLTDGEPKSYVLRSTLVAGAAVQAEAMHMVGWLAPVECAVRRTEAV